MFGDDPEEDELFGGK
jgi:hypothetical protein